MYVKYKDYTNTILSAGAKKGPPYRIYTHCIECRRQLLPNDDVWCVRTESKIKIRMTGECRQCRESRPRKIRQRIYRETELQWRQKYPKLKIYCCTCSREFNDTDVRRHVVDHRPYNTCIGCYKKRSLLYAAHYKSRGELLHLIDQLADKRWVRPLPEKCPQCRVSYHVAQYVVCPVDTKLGYRVLPYCSACCKL